MEFLAIIGDPGSGKTNMMVKYLYAEHRTGSPIASNLRTLKLPQVYMGFDDLIKAAEDDNPILHNRYVGTDELGVGADSYEFLGKANRGLVKLNTQRRKFGIRWVYTVQRWSMISRRLRQLTDGFISMTDPDKNNMFHPDGRRARIHREVCRGVFRAEYFDRDMRLIHRRMFNGRKYWGLYSTDERIDSPGSLQVSVSNGKVLVPDDGEDEDY